MNRQHADHRKPHDRTLELAATAVDVALTSAEASELEAHLAACTTCARRAAALHADVSALSRPLTLLPSTRVDDAVYAEIARRPGRPQRVLLLAAAALVIVALLGIMTGGAYLLRERQGLPTTVLPSPTAPLVVASPRPTPSSAVGKTWGTIAIPASDVGTGWIGRMEAVAITESALVAVGGPVCAPRSEPTTCRASAWTATPSGGWTRAPDDPSLALGLTFPTSGPQPGMFDVATGPAGLVGIGFDYDPQATGPGIWRSPDGRTWERVKVDFGSSPVEAYRNRIVAVAAGPQGYVIVGYLIDGDPAPDIGARAAAWTSPDGVTWTRAADTADMDVGPCVDTGEEPACGGMRAVVATASGFVAVGHGRTSADSAAPSRPAAWTSTDGSSWTRSDAGLDFDGSLSGVTVGGPGLVAVGTMCLPDCVGSAAGGVAAASVDGATWRANPVSGAAALSDVATAGGPVFALGVPNPDESPPGELQLWRSGDGDTWMRVTNLPAIPDATGYPAVDIAATEDRLVIVGWADVTGADTIRNFAYVSPTSPSR